MVQIHGVIVGESVLLAIIKGYIKAMIFSITDKEERIYTDTLPSVSTLEIPSILVKIEDI